MNKTEKIEAMMQKAKINTRRVSVIGSFVHIDTFKKYEAKLVDMFSAAGAKLVMVREGAHMDGFDGFRIVFKF